MAVPQRQSEMPTQEAIQGALSRLCTRGLRPFWILEVGRVLLGLDCVRRHVRPGSNDERDYVVALREYLEDAVQRVESPQYRTILEIVLGLGDDRWKTKAWRHEKASVRRREAGLRFRGDDETVEPNTIRQHHEPRAIRQLAEIVWRDENKARSDD
jgi:hypothetical protein